MRICFICVGGFGHIEPYLNYFKMAGHDVHFIALTPAPDYSVPTYNLGFGRKYSKTEGKWKYPISILRARRLLKKIRPDIVHTHYVTSGGLTGLLCGFHPTITTIHGSDLNLSLKSQLWRNLLKLIFNHADCINTCTEDQKRKVIGLGINPEKIRVLTVGIDVDKFPLVWPQRRNSHQMLRLVTTRSLDWIYDHATIIKALTIIRSKGINFQMTFIAGGPLQEELTRQVEREKLTDCIKFLGGVDKSKIVKILHENDVFLSAPLYDGISVALLEAIATGLFPIVSNIDVNSDWLKDGVDGFLHKAGDPRDLADCILKIYYNPQLAIKAAENNRRKVIQLADTKTNMKLLEKVYQELVNRKYRNTTEP